MAARTTFGVGDFLVWQGQGLVRVEGTRQIDGKPFWVVKSVEAGSTLIIPYDAVEKVIRMPVSRPEAERLAGVLRQQTGAADERRWAVRFHEAMVALLKRPLEAQVSTLHTLYRAGYAPTFGERKLVDTFERLIMGELAHVLGKNVDAMVAELRSGHPAFAATLLKRPPDPPLAEPTAPIAVKNHGYLGAISSPTGSIVVGEPTASDSATYVAQGMPGEWHVYVTDSSEDDVDDGESLLLIHSDALGQHDKLLQNLATIADLDVAGGTMAMISAEVRDDEAFQEAAMFPVGPIVQGSGCVLHTGNGVHRLRGTKIAYRFAVLVVNV